MLTDAQKYSVANGCPGLSLEEAKRRLGTAQINYKVFHSRSNFEDFVPRASNPLNCSVLVDGDKVVDVIWFNERPDLVYGPGRWLLALFLCFVLVLAFIAIVST